MPRKSDFFLSPHALHPPMDGASARSWGICNAASSLNRAESIYLAKHQFISVSGTEATPFLQIKNNRSKTRTGIQALLQQRHYLEVKHTPRNWIRAALRTIEIYNPDLLYINFFWVTPPFLKTVRKRRLVVDTHNYDPEWWSNLESTSRKPWEKALCRISHRSILQTLKKLPKETILVHVSKADSERYRTWRPDLIHLVLPNGCTIHPRRESPIYSGPRKKIYFLGALNLQMTRDALEYFESRFWPSLSDFCEMHVIGSGHSTVIEEIAYRNSWLIHRNIKSDDLSALLTEMHYLVLPFHYGAGSKLKFIGACARTIPVISTKTGISGFDQVPPTVHVSEDPYEWKELIAHGGTPTVEAISACLNFAQKYSWDYLVEEIWPQIMLCPPVS
jgi:hypothetical protein